MRTWKVRRKGSSWTKWTLNLPLWVLEQMLNWVNVNLSGHSDRAMRGFVYRGRLKGNGSFSSYSRHGTMKSQEDWERYSASQFEGKMLNSV